MLATACTDGPTERAVPTTAAPASTTIVTLPPVGVFTYPTGAGDVVTQISVDVDGPLLLPLLTVYGNGRAITGFGEMWVAGQVNDLDLQAFFDDARSLGLLDDDLVLRGPGAEGLPDIEVVLDVDGRRFVHELDLVRIERPAALRAFLQRSATANIFELTTPYEPAVWLNCTGDGCVSGDSPSGDFSRPVLAPHEDVDTLAAEAARGES